KESFEDAEYLVKEERWNAAANRMYYSCFYVVSAYLAFKGLTAATHSGLKSAFNQELIKTGRIDRIDQTGFCLTGYLLSGSRRTTKILPTSNLKKLSPFFQRSVI
ncbi:MAG: HEPN domain-containing protein, partial [Saprospiraceae bacterium]